MRRLHRRHRVFRGTRSGVRSRHGVPGFAAGGTELRTSHPNQYCTQHHTKVSTGRALKTAPLAGKLSVVILSPLSLTMRTSPMLHTRSHTVGNVVAAV